MNEHCDYLCAKERSILVKRHYRNPSEYNKETLIDQSNQCTKLIIEAKQNYMAKMSSKLDCLDTASKTYWAAINRFLNKKRYQIYRCRKVRVQIELGRTEIVCTKLYNLFLGLDIFCRGKFFTLTRSQK